MPDSTAAPDQGNRTSELDTTLQALSNWTAEFYKEDTPHWMPVMNPAAGSMPFTEAKAALQRLISQEAARLARQAVDGVTLNEIIDAGLFPTPDEHKNMLGLLDVVRRRLDALQGGTEG